MQRLRGNVLVQFAILGALLSPALAVSPGPINMPLTGVTLLQTLRLNVLGGPTGCVATLSFTDSTGAPVGSSLLVNLGTMQATSLDLPGSTVAKKLGQRGEVIALVTPVPGAVADCSPSVEVFDNLTAFDRVYKDPGPVGKDPGPVGFSMVGLGQLQTLRLKAQSADGDSCVGTLGFFDANGVPVGPRMDVSLAPGQGTWLALDGNTLVTKFGQRVTVSPGPQQISGSCIFSAEVFEQITGSTLVTVNPGPIN